MQNTLFLVFFILAPYYFFANAAFSDNNPLSLSNVKKGKKVYIEQAHRPLRGGQKNQKLLDKIALESKNMASEDVCRFIDKDVSLDQPHVPDTYIHAWFALAATDIMTFGFNNHEFRLGLASDYFTIKGWESFAESLEKNRIIEMMEAHQQVLTTAPKGAPILRSKGFLNYGKYRSKGIMKDTKYQWVLEIPMAMTYQSGALSNNTGQIITAVIKRSDQENHPCGIAIDQWFTRAINAN